MLKPFAFAALYIEYGILWTHQMKNADKSSEAIKIVNSATFIKVWCYF